MAAAGRAGVVEAVEAVVGAAAAAVVAAVVPPSRDLRAACPSLMQMQARGGSMRTSP